MLTHTFPAYSQQEKVPFLVLTIRYEQLDILILRRVLDKTVQAHFDIIEQHGNASESQTASSFQLSPGCPRTQRNSQQP